MIVFKNTFSCLPSFLFERVNLSPILNPSLINVSKINDQLELNLTDEELKSWLNGQLNLPGEQRISTRYAGHQSGLWAGQLGDGSAILIEEIV